MKNEINNIKEKNNKKFIQNQTPNIAIKQKIPNDKIIEKESPMMSIRNMFTLNNEKNNNINNNTFSNSFYKSSQQSNQEESHNNNYVSLMPRTFSNNHLNNEQQYLNNKNFPSKANVCKGNPKCPKNYMHPNSSPIFQYYASNQGGQDLGSSLENGNSLGYLGGRDSPQSTGFNYSPSDIFNNSHGNIGSGFIKNRSETNIGGAFSIDSEVDEDKFKNLDFKIPLDDLCIEFDDSNFDINFAEDINITMNKLDQIKNKKSNEKHNQNDNIFILNNNNNLNNNINKKEETNNHINSNNDVIIEIKRKTFKFTN